MDYQMNHQQGRSGPSTSSDSRQYQTERDTEGIPHRKDYRDYPPLPFEPRSWAGDAAGYGYLATELRLGLQEAPNRKAAYCSQAEFQLIWTFLCYVPIYQDNSGLGIPFIQLDGNHQTKYNLVERHNRMSTMCGEWIGRIVHQHVWGCPGSLDVDFIIQEQKGLRAASQQEHLSSSQLNATREALMQTCRFIKQVDNNILFFVDEVRRAYTTWYKAHGSFDNMRVWPTIAIMTHDQVLQDGFSHPFNYEERKDYDPHHARLAMNRQRPS